MSNDREKLIRRKMVHDLVKRDLLPYKAAKTFVRKYGGDPITFSVNYNALVNKKCNTNISLANNDVWPELSLALDDVVPPPFRIKSTYYMSVEQETMIRETTWGS